LNLTVGYIPYLNMVPFHQGFVPAPMKDGDVTVQFRQLSPRILGVEAESGRIDAGALSLVDAFRLADRFEPLGDFGIGVKRAAGSVLLFSKRPLAELEGICAVTDETSTSVRLLQVLLEKRYQREGVTYGRVASGEMYDGSAEALLLIGDEALRAKREGIRELPVVTDLATEWYAWQGTPFVFARWMARKNLPEAAKSMLERNLINSLKSMILSTQDILYNEGNSRSLAPAEVKAYWDGFLLELSPAHKQAIDSFKELLESICLNV
jgi:chorismate dehydratase